MSFGIAGAVIGAGAAVYGATKASKSADRAADKADDAAKAQLAFEQQRYDDWNAVYGPIRQNLASYYNTVTPDFYAAVGLEEFEKERTAMMTRIDEDLAQRGITNSAVGASINAQSELNAAETRAGIRGNAPRLAAEDKSRFLQIGLGQNPANNVSSALNSNLQLQANRASTAGGMANYANNQAGQAVSNAVGTIGTALSDYYAKPQSTGAYAGTPYINYDEGLV